MSMVDNPPQPGRLNRSAFGGLLLSAMAAGTLMATSLGFFASSLLDEFGISRRQFGLLLTASIVFGAAVSPSWGRIADRYGGRWTLVAVFATGALSFFAMSIAPAFGFLFIGAVIASFSQAASNPATNKLITHHVPPGGRGTVTGIKQSGVQAATFVSGVTIPWGAATFGWRWTMVLMGALIAVFIPVSLRFLPDDAPHRGHPGAHRSADPLPGSVKWLTVYGLLLGMAGATGFLVPLFAEEDIGMSVTAAGLVGAVIGLSAFIGRIAWARWAEPRLAFGEALALIAAITVVGALVMLAASPSRSYLAWPGAVLLGLSVQSWNAPGMLAVMADAGPQRAGRASGVVVLGFLAGLGIAPPIYGQTADAASTPSGAYDTMWWLALAVAAVAFVLSLAWLRSKDRITAAVG